MIPTHPRNHSSHLCPPILFPLNPFLHHTPSLPPLSHTLLSCPVPLLSPLSPSFPTPSTTFTLPCHFSIFPSLPPLPHSNKALLFLCTTSLLNNLLPFPSTIIRPQSLSHHIPPHSTTLHHIPPHSTTPSPPIPPPSALRPPFLAATRRCPTSSPPHWSTTCFRPSPSTVISLQSIIPSPPLPLPLPLLSPPSPSPSPLLSPPSPSSSPLPLPFPRSYKAMLFLVIASLLYYRARITIEESMLLKAFPEYKQYCQRVPYRILPYVY
ncbi:unnamed protein product [Closterium sp. NIES-54]